ncbi:MAG: hypothetical protein KDD61_09010 [Bdellovibrionales bacterium]|nr:hypothetical protein [Bdellovibrionales bacterium]
MKTVSRYIGNLLVLILSTVIIFVLPFQNNAQAHEVSKVKGKKVLITVEDGEMGQNLLFYTLTPSGKKTGIVKIMKVKNSRAIGKILKGKVKAGYLLQLREKKGQKSAQKSSDRKSNRRDKTSDATGNMYWGGIFGFATSSMSVKFANDAGTADLTGSGMSAKGLFDFALFNSLWFRGLVGAEIFDVKGTAKDSAGAATAACNNSSECKVALTYLSADLWGRYIFSKGGFRPWVGAGFLLLFPLSKEVTALDEKSVTNTSNFALGGGFDWFFGKKKNMFVPFQVEYDLYPSSEQVSANSIAVRIGFGMQL